MKYPEKYIGEVIQGDCLDNVRNATIKNQKETKFYV